MEDTAAEDKGIEQVEAPAEPTTPSTPLAALAADPLAAASGWMSAGSSWGASWLTSAKQKTMDTFQLVKKDLDEFTEVVTNEAKSLSRFGSEKDPASAAPSNVTSPTTETVAAASAPAADEGDKVDPIEAQLEKITNAGLGFMKSLVDTVKAFGIEDTTKDEDESTEIIRPHKTLRNSPLSKIRLMELQASEDTFLVPPEESADYDTFAELFSISEHDGEINHLLSTNPPMRAIFSSLVPEKVDNVTFWMRYFYKLELAEATESKKIIDKEIVPESIKREQPASPAHSTDDWSVCSPGEGEIQEIETDHSTPTPSETSPDDVEHPETTEKDEEEKKTKKDGDWVDWDE
ncbi:hypothetical protein PFISCL1PPCAC_597 [Pristionchus fissidentatus]|uniref:BSD domain-containing protein n=1 Tax=Pristionchus fissidentatus TaxID=1538716 RepID=A0AAV5UUV6_9BILA|nr:hypothetical protein PFISCL1PPCAC_597 [Pristionchus fissidentatus]